MYIAKWYTVPTISSYLSHMKCNQTQYVTFNDFWSLIFSVQFNIYLANFLFVLQSKVTVNFTGIRSCAANRYSVCAVNKRRFCAGKIHWFCAVIRHWVCVVNIYLVCASNRYWVCLVNRCFQWVCMSRERKVLICKSLSNVMFQDKFRVSKCLIFHSFIVKTTLPPLVTYMISIWHGNF